MSKKTAVYKRPEVKLCPLGLKIKIQGPEGALNLGPECHRAKKIIGAKRKFADCLLAFHPAHQQHKKRRQDETGKGEKKKKKRCTFLPFIINILLLASVRGCELLCRIISNL